MKVLAWAKDEEIRAKGSSGGFVTAAMIAALEKGLVDEVVVVKKKDAYEGIPITTNNVEVVKECIGSMHFAPLNLSYFIKNGVKTALPTKPCDARAIIERAKRNQVNIDDVYMVGLNCGGTFNPIVAKEVVLSFFEIEPESVIKEEILKGKLIVEYEGGKKSVKIDEIEEEGYGRRNACKICDINIPYMADLACGNWGVLNEKATFVEVFTEKGKEFFENAVDAGYVEFREAKKEEIEIREKIDKAMIKLAKKWREKLDEINDLDRKERLDYYIRMFEKCIGCNACKEVCPPCVCEEAKCVSMNDEMAGYKIPLYNLVRLLHLMDSCIGCGQCEDVCPVDIPLTLIHKRFSERILKRLDYIPGIDMQKPPFQETRILFD